MVRKDVGEQSIFLSMFRRLTLASWRVSAFLQNIEASRGTIRLGFLQSQARSPVEVKTC